MSVFSYEWKKMMLYQRGLCYILAALLVSTVWLAATDRPQNSAMEEYREEYEWYLERLDGACTEEKAAWLEQEAQAITEARYSRTQSQESYYNGQITQEQYERQIAEVSAVLINEHGFEAAYQQYLYICENTANRYFLNTNGWAGLFSAQTLDFPLFLVILILAATVFCSEYSCQMDALLRTAPQSRKSARSKAIITLCAVFALCGGLALIRFAFFGIKYGLPHGEYPVQSIASFGGSTKNISLLAAYLILTVLRCFGSVYLAALLLFTSVLVKKYALTIVIGVASTLIPYIGMSRQICYHLPLPLPFLLATGFLKGTSSTEDSLTGEPIVTFLERSPQEALTLLGLSAASCSLMIWWVLRQNTNCWQSERKLIKRHSVAALSLLLLFSLSGCSVAKSATGIFNSASHSVSENYSVIFNDQTQTYSLANRATGVLTDLPLSPLFGIFSDEEYVKAVYMDATYIYYMVSRTERHVDRVGSYNSTATQVSIVRLNTETFDEQVIFEKITDSEQSLLGIDYTVGDTWRFLQYCYGFFLNENSFFFITNDGITEVNRTTQRTQMLDIPTKGNIAFDGMTIYFINENSLLTAYDTKTHKAGPLQNIVAYDFCLTEQGLYFINRLDSDCVYLCGQDGAHSSKISNDPALSVGYDGEKVTLILKSDGKEIIFEPLFDKMTAISGEQIVGLALQNQLNDLQADLNNAKSENSKANKEYEALKSELLKAIQGKSELPKDVLSEMLEESRNKVLDSSKRVTDLTLQLEQKNGIIADMKAEYDRIASWSEIFDQSDMAVKKMICSYIIEKVVVHKGYELEVKFNISVEQFLNGIDSVTDKLPIAQ